MESRRPQKSMEREMTESMLGFAGFRRRGAPSVDPEGLLKVTQSEREDRSGFLTLTFILDAEGQTLRDRQLPVLDAAALRAALGPRFEMALDLPLRGHKPGSSYWVEEIDLYFRPLDPFPVPFLAEVLLPVLGQQLNLDFEPLSDWIVHPALDEKPGSMSIWQRLLHWLRLT